MTRQEFKRKFCAVCDKESCFGIDNDVCRFACEKYKQVQTESKGITEEELLESGWRKENCKIGMLYFAGMFFGSLKDGVFTLYHTSNDMCPIGHTKSFDEIKALQKDYFVKETNALESVLYSKRSTTSRYYGKCDFKYTFEMLAFRKVLEEWHESKFDSSIDWEARFREELDKQYDNYELGEHPNNGKQLRFYK